jgi:hypothetical protein
LASPGSVTVTRPGRRAHHDHGERYVEGDRTERTVEPTRQNGVDAVAAHQHAGHGASVRFAGRLAQRVVEPRAGLLGGDCFEEGAQA